VNRTIGLVASLLVAMLVLVGCGGDDSPSETPAGAPYNDADVTFATDLIEHHAQALQMVDLTLGRDLDPEIAAIAESIRSAQVPEIETMADWLEEWGQPVPETGRDHANAHGDGADLDSDMPGMMSAAELQALEDADGGAFERTWLEAMIEHHQGAVTMATVQTENGMATDALELAASVVTSQSAEIEQMRDLLG